MGLVPVDKYNTIYLAFPSDVVMTVAMREYREKFGVKATKAVVPIRSNKHSPFNYDIENLAEGADIEIEPSRSVSMVYLTNHNIVWANSPRLIPGVNGERPE